MTRLETLFDKLDQEVDKSGEYAFDPMPVVKEYLAERDDFVIGTAQTGHNYMSADEARVKLQLEQRGRASQFDNGIPSIRVCCHCGNKVEVESEPEIDYPYYCPTCDENMYAFETTTTDGQYGQAFDDMFADSLGALAKL